MSESLARIARDASLARVPMSHTPRDAEYLAVLAYRVAQESRACEARLAALAALASDVAEAMSATTTGRSL
jgi:hypothetical protein